jgi:capsular polysaccharide biosynthesis protein
MGRTDTPIEKPIVLAPTYAYFATDDTVMRALEKKYGKPLNAKIAAFPVNNSPVVQLTVEGSDPNYITKVAATAQQAFIAELESYQKTNNIPEESRIVVRPLGPASEPELVVSRQYEILAVLFMLPVIAFIGLALLVDNAKRKREAEPAVQAAHEPVELEASPEAAQATGALVHISGGDR